MTRPRRSSAAPAGFGRLDRPATLTARVEQMLRDAISEGRFPTGKLPTEAELAEQLGVSRETVRLAAEVLQREGLLVKVRRRGTFLRAQPLPEAILPAPSRLVAYLQAGYPASQGAEEVVTQVVSGLMLQGALERAAEARLSLVVRHASHLDLGQAFAQMQQEVRLRGLLVASFGEEKTLRRFASLGLPVVLLDHDVSLPGVHTVRDDSTAAARQAVLDLAALGHRVIAFVDWRRGELNRWRREGYREGLRAAGLSRRRSWEIAAEFTEAGARQAVEQLLALPTRPTAVYCFNNTVARLVISELQRRGLAVPADVSVVGGGGEEVPGLSCHQADWVQMGRCGVEVLLRALEAEAGSSPEHHCLGHVQRPGQTSGPPR